MKYWYLEKFPLEKVSKASMVSNTIGVMSQKVVWKQKEVSSMFSKGVGYLRDVLFHIGIYSSKDIKGEVLPTSELVFGSLIAALFF